MEFKILGIGDKRPVVYPLMRVLSLLGGACLITDDTSYRVLFKEGGSSGFIGNTFLYADSCIQADKIPQSEYYNHTVWAVTPTDFIMNGFTICVRRDWSPMELTPHDPDLKNIHIGFRPPPEKDMPFIPLTENLLKELNTVEADRAWRPIMNAKVNSVLSPILAGSFGKSEKEMKKLFRYKGEKQL